MRLLRLPGVIPAEARTRTAHLGAGASGEDPKVTARPGQELPAQLTVEEEHFRSRHRRAPPLARGVAES